ncbi:MAG: GspE/PulE family protein [Myxococcota bacterium]
MARKKIRIGELLVENKVISEAQLRTALETQKKTGLKLGRQLIEAGYVTEDRFHEFLSHQLEIPHVDLARYEIRKATAELLPETYSRRFRAIVLDVKNGTATVGMADPTNIFAMDEIERILKLTVEPAIVRESELLAAIDRTYSRASEIHSLAEELHEELDSGSDFDLSQLDANVGESEAAVVRLLKSIFEDAVRTGTSDIHIEPDETCLRIRQRIDGVLHEQVMKEARISAALVLRLKLMAGLNISERRLPQDGRFNIRVGDRGIDIRLSTMPVQWGESVVMRLLDQSQGALGLDRIGMPGRILRRFRHFIHQPHGLVLVTGPTGSGKTTTLYGALSELNEPTKKIISCEDPVEYRLPRIQQVQVNVKIGLTFASVLRSALRQDPDIVMIGEMRDQETAEIGLRAAMTGHLVFSTLHTNSAAGSAARLLDMGAEGFLVATALSAVLAQRLVRRVCDACTEPHALTSQEKMWLRANAGESAEFLNFLKPRGCPRCNGTGYRGRTGVYELLEIDEAMADALRRSDTHAYIEAASRSVGFRPLAICALEYASKGITSLDEVLRIAGEQEDTGGNLKTRAAKVAPAG